MAAAKSPGKLPTRKGLRIGCLNTNCMTNKMDDIERLIVDNKFDVFVIVETCLKEKVEKEKEVKIPGYTFRSFPGSYDKRGRGGILIYFRAETINYRVNNEGCYEVPEKRIQFAEVSIIKPVDLYLLAVYNPSSAHTANLYESLISHLEQMNAKTKNVMVLGDFNINLDPDRKLIDSGNQQILRQDYDLEQLIEEATHVNEDRDYETYIDHIYYSGKHEVPVIQKGVIKSLFSDHYAIWCVLKLG